MVVMQLLRAIGTKVRLIAAALSQNAPLLEEELPEQPDARQLAKLRQLLAVLETAAVRPRITFDGREIPGRVLYELIEAGERMLARSPE